jgi:DNA-directed RNA polymerase sigma subunit (sigma70/sigma32)
MGNKNLTIYDKLEMITDESKKHKEIYLFRMGYTNGVPHTLQETADACGLKSRQRVHQICCDIYFKLKDIEGGCYIPKKYSFKKVEKK